MSKLRESYFRIAGQDNEIIESPVVPVNATEIILDVSSQLAHYFGGVLFYNDAEGATLLDPATLTGTATVTAKTINSSFGFQEVNNGILDVSVIDQSDWAGNTLQVRAAFSAITGATHAKLIITANRS